MLGQWPLAIVLLGVAGGLAIVAATHWRIGCTVIGGALAVGGVLRMILGKKRSGLLAVRRPAVDVVVMLGIGVGILVLAWLAPGYGN